MIPVEIRDLKTGEVLTAVGHNAIEILASREKHPETCEPGKGPRRFVQAGSEPEGWVAPKRRRKTAEGTPEDIDLSELDQGEEEPEEYVNVPKPGAPVAKETNRNGKRQKEKGRQKGWQKGPQAQRPQTQVVAAPFAHPGAATGPLTPAKEI